MFTLYVQLYVLITIPIVVCLVFWAGGLSFPIYLINLEIVYKIVLIPYD